MKPSNYPFHEEYPIDPWRAYSQSQTRSHAEAITKLLKLGRQRFIGGLLMGFGIGGLVGMWLL